MANLSSKELTGIEDQLTSEKNLISKYSMYGDLAEDGEIKNKLYSIASKHQEHYNQLVSLLG